MIVYSLKSDILQGVLKHSPEFQTALKEHTFTTLIPVSRIPFTHTCKISCYLKIFHYPTHLWCLLYDLCTTNISQNCDWRDARIGIITSVLVGEDKNTKRILKDQFLWKMRKLYSTLLGKQKYREKVMILCQQGIYQEISGL